MINFKKAVSIVVIFSLVLCSCGNNGPVKRDNGSDELADGKHNLCYEVDGLIVEKVRLSKGDVIDVKHIESVIGDRCPEAGCKFEVSYCLDGGCDSHIEESSTEWHPGLVMSDVPTLLRQSKKNKEEARITKLQKDVVKFCNQGIVEFGTKEGKVYAYPKDKAITTQEEAQKCDVAVNEAKAFLIDKDGTLRRLEEEISKASEVLDTCREREHSYFDTADYRRDRVCDKEGEAYSELEEQHNNTLEFLLDKMGKEDVPGFLDIVRKRAEVLVPKKTLGPDEKGLTSYFGPRVGRGFIRLVNGLFTDKTGWFYNHGFGDIENAKGVKAFVWLTVAGLVSNILSPGGLLLGAGGGAAMFSVTRDIGAKEILSRSVGHGGIYPFITYLMLAGISAFKAKEAVDKNPDSAALELVGEVCGQTNAIAAMAGVATLGVAFLGIGAMDEFWWKKIGRAEIIKERESAQAKAIKEEERITLRVEQMSAREQLDRREWSMRNEQRKDELERQANDKALEHAQEYIQTFTKKYKLSPEEAEELRLNKFNTTKVAIIEELHLNEFGITPTTPTDVAITENPQLLAKMDPKAEALKDADTKAKEDARKYAQGYSQVFNQLQTNSQLQVDQVDEEEVYKKALATVKKDARELAKMDPQVQARRDFNARKWAKAEVHAQKYTRVFTKDYKLSPEDKEILRTAKCFKAYEILLGENPQLLAEMDPKAEAVRDAAAKAEADARKYAQGYSQEFNQLQTYKKAQVKEQEVYEEALAMVKKDARDLAKMDPKVQARKDFHDLVWDQSETYARRYTLVFTEDYKLSPKDKRELYYKQFCLIHDAIIEDPKILARMDPEAQARIDANTKAEKDAKKFAQEYTQEHNKPEGLKLWHVIDKKYYMVTELQEEADEQEVYEEALEIAKEDARVLAKMNPRALAQKDVRAQHQAQIKNLVRELKQKEAAAKVNAKRQAKVEAQAEAEERGRLKALDLVEYYNLADFQADTYARKYVRVFTKDYKLSPEAKKVLYREKYCRVHEIVRAGLEVEVDPEVQARRDAAARAKEDARKYVKEYNKSEGRRAECHFVEFNGPVIAELRYGETDEQRLHKEVLAIVKKDARVLAKMGPEVQAQEDKKAQIKALVKAQYEARIKVLKQIEAHVKALKQFEAKDETKKAKDEADEVKAVAATLNYINKYVEEYNKFLGGQRRFSVDTAYGRRIVILQGEADAQEVQKVYDETLAIAKKDAQVLEKMDPQNQARRDLRVKANAQGKAEDEAEFKAKKQADPHYTRAQFRAESHVRFHDQTLAIAQSLGGNVPVFEQEDHAHAPAEDESEDEDLAHRGTQSRKKKKKKGQRAGGGNAPVLEQEAHAEAPAEGPVASGPVLNEVD